MVEAIVCVALGERQEIDRIEGNSFGASRWQEKKRYGATSRDNDSPRLHIVGAGCLCADQPGANRTDIGLRVSRKRMVTGRSALQI